MVSRGGSRVPTSLPLGHPGSPAHSTWPDHALWAEQRHCQAAAPFPSPFLFIRAWVSPLSFPPPREDREGGLCHLLPPAPCLHGTTMLSTGITPALGRAVPARAKTQWRGRAVALGDVSGSRRQLLLLLPHIDAETSFAHRCLLPMMLNCSRRWGRWGRFGPTEPGMGQLGGSAPPPSPPLSLVEPAAASPIAPRVRAHCCEEPRAPGDFFVSRAEALGSGLGWTCQGEAAQGVSCAGWDHQVLLRMAGPAKATHRGSPYLPWSKGSGQGKHFSPLTHTNAFGIVIIDHLQLFILRNVQRKMALAHTNPALWHFSHH